MPRALAYTSPVVPRIPPSRRRARASLLALALAASSAWPRTADAGEPKGAGSIEAPAARDASLTEARARVADGDLDAARAIYERLLGADASDDEARFGLARLDAWQGRLAEAEATLRALLARRPRDADVRAALSDVVSWRGRVGEAEALVDEGLALDPGAAPLLARRATLRHRRGDEAAAIDDADRAEAGAPGDPDVRALRDRLFHGEARAIGRVELFSAGLPTLPAGELQLTQRIGRWSVGARTEHGARFASATGGRDYNATYAASVGRALGGGLVVSLDAGAGAPATAVPRWFAQLAGEGPLTSRLGARLALGHRAYPNGVDVELAAPALSFAPTDALLLSARYWLAIVRSPDAAVAAGADRARLVHSVGAGVRVTRGARLSFGFDWAYGAQLDLTPEIFRLTSVRAHVLDAWVDALVTRGFGLRPLYRFETRSTDAFRYQVHALELAAYTRW